MVEELSPKIAHFSFCVAGSHAYFHFGSPHSPKDFRKSALFFFSQTLTNAQIEYCTACSLKGKVMYWDVGIGLGLHAESNIPNRTIGCCSLAMGVSVARVLSATSSAGSGDTTPQNTV